MSVRLSRTGRGRNDSSRRARVLSKRLPEPSVWREQRVNRGGRPKTFPIHSAGMAPTRAIHVGRIVGRRRPTSSVTMPPIYRSVT